MDCNMVLGISDGELYDLQMEFAKSCPSFQLLQQSTYIICFNFQLTGKLVEYDEPMKLMNKEESLFGQLVQEYWSRSANNGTSLEDW